MKSPCGILLKGVLEPLTGVPTLKYQLLLLLLLCKELFSNIERGDHKLSHLLPARPRRNYHLRSNRKFVVPDCKTNRYRDSFIISHCT